LDSLRLPGGEFDRLLPYGSWRSFGKECLERLSGDTACKQEKRPDQKRYTFERCVLLT